MINKKIIIMILSMLIIPAVYALSIGEILTQQDIDDLPIFGIPITWHEYAVHVNINQSYFVWGLKFPTIVKIYNTSLYNVTWYRHGYHLYFNEFTECIALRGVNDCVSYVHNDINVSTEGVMLYERAKIAMWKTNPPWHAFNWSMLSIEGNPITIIY